MTEESEKSQKVSETYSCECCGATLKYEPGTAFLHCEYCGSDTPIEANVVVNVNELDYMQYIQHFEEINTHDTRVIKCRKCGAESTFDANMKSMECPYCGTPLIEADAHYERLIKPSYLLPFRVSGKEVNDYLYRWLRKLWFAPDNLKEKARCSANLQGVYIPCWTYDAQTETEYSGQRGVTYTVTAGTGKNQRTETRTRWTFRCGHISLFFDDVIGPASKLIASQVVAEIENWDTENLVEMDDRFLSGFVTEKYMINLKQGFDIARGKMASEIDAAIRQDIGGDRQRILSRDTRFDNIKFKLILLPVYMSFYLYGKKVYHFFVNGRTGEITGNRPYSTMKIVFTVILGLLVLGGIICWMNTQ